VSEAEIESATRSALSPLTAGDDMPGGKEERPRPDAADADADAGANADANANGEG
jgi:hypothetical protein